MEKLAKMFFFFNTIRKWSCYIQKMYKIKYLYKTKEKRELYFYKFLIRSTGMEGRYGWYVFYFLLIISAALSGYSGSGYSGYSGYSTVLSLALSIRVGPDDVIIQELRSAGLNNVTCIVNCNVSTLPSCRRETLIFYL